LDDPPCIWPPKAKAGGEPAAKARRRKGKRGGVEGDGADPEAAAPHGHGSMTGAVGAKFPTPTLGRAVQAPATAAVLMLCVPSDRSGPPGRCRA